MKSNRRKVLLFTLTCILLVTGFWFWLNPPGRIGLHCKWFTVYSGIPYPVLDLLIHTDGSAHMRDYLSWPAGRRVYVWELEGLMDSQDDKNYTVIIVGTGYGDPIRWQLRVDDEVRSRFGPSLEIYPSPEAVRRYNLLRKAGRKTGILLYLGN